MPNFDNWTANSELTPATAEQRAVLAWNRIQDRPSSVTLSRDGTGALSAQTVRIEYGETSGPQRGDVGQTNIRDVWLIGVVDHPDTDVDDTDIQEHDRFAMNYQTYVVLDVIRLPGEVQARCERVAS